MIQEEHKNKEKDIKGITRQACSLLDTAWTKGYVAGFNDGYATRREADKEIMESLHPKGRWIPVSESLPEDMQSVLVWFEYYRYGNFNCMYQTYGFGYVCDGKWSSFINGETGWQDYRIIAWQPLPEPYKEAEE